MSTLQPTSSTTVRRRLVAVGSVVLVLATLPALAQEIATSSHQERFSSRAQREQFLLSAKIVSRERLDVGVTDSERATLDDGHDRHDAHVQTINVMYQELNTGRRTYRFFRDSYRYNVAASKLDELLGLGMVPVSVERRVGRQRAAVTWWVDDVLMMEIDRIRSGLAPPNPQQWIHQREQARLFSELVANADYNPTNVLIDGDWKLWLIDFSRAFRERWGSRLDRPPLIDRQLYQALQRLDWETVRAELGAYLSKPEMRELLARRDRILESYGASIAEHGESSVLCARHP